MRSSWSYYSYLRHDITEHTPEEDKEWFCERLRDGKKLRKCLPVQGELHWKNATYHHLPAILPKNAISRNGYINEIWVPGDACEIRIGDASFIGISLDVPIAYTRNWFYFWIGSDRDVLLLSYRKLKVIPYLCKMTSSLGDIV